MAYELSMFHSIELGSCIRFGNTSFDIPATGVDQLNNTAKLRKSTFSTEGFLKAKIHRRDKVCHHCCKQALLAAAQCIRAAHDAHIPAHTVKPVEVEGNFADECEWLVEKILLSGSKAKFFTVPNSLISSSNPFIPITNTSDTPRYIHKGEIVGEITDPAKFFNSPKTAEQHNKYVQSVVLRPVSCAVQEGTTFSHKGRAERR